MKPFLLAFVALLGIVASEAQSLEGVVTYSVEYEVVLEDRPDLEIYKTMIPEKMELSLKGQNSLLKFVGGMAQGLIGDILYRAKEQTLYSIFHFNQTVLKTPVEILKNQTDKSVFQAVKTQEKTQIIGYDCTKYIVKDEKEGTETILWCTTSISNASASVMAYFLESMTQLGVTGLEGLPLKIQFKGKEFDLTLLAESKEKKKMSSALFMVPKDYKPSKVN